MVTARDSIPISAPMHRRSVANVGGSELEVGGKRVCYQLGSCIKCHLASVVPVRWPTIDPRLVNLMPNLHECMYALGGCFVGVTYPDLKQSSYLKVPLIATYLPTRLTRMRIALTSKHQRHSFGTFAMPCVACLAGHMRKTKKTPTNNYSDIANLAITPLKVEALLDQVYSPTSNNLAVQHDTLTTDDLRPRS